MRMQHDGAHGNRLPGLESLDLIGAAGRHAMGGGEHQIARERGAGAQVLVCVDHHHDGGAA